MSSLTRHPMAARLAAVVTVSCLLALGACGGDEDADADASASDASVSETTASETVSTPATEATTEPSPPTSAAPTTAAAPTSTEIPDTTAPAPTTGETPDTTAPATSAPEAVSGTEPALCGPYLEVSAAFSAEPDPATVSALLDQVDAAAPPDIAEQLAVVTDGARTVLETGDFGVFEGPDFSEAVTAADAWVFENCEFVTTTEIVASEYEYTGQADAYPAGRTGFALVNDGAEAHELAIIRKNDGVDLTLEELLQLPEADAEQMTTFVGATFVGPPGARSNLVVELEPGNYVAVCNVPAGTMVAEDGSFTEGSGPPHVMVGMSFEFSVS